MTYSEPARTSTRAPRRPAAGVLILDGRIPRRGRVSQILVAGLLVVIAVALGYQLLASSPPTAASSTDVVRIQPGAALAPGGEQLPPLAAASDRGAARAPRMERGGAIAEADGAVPDGTTVFDGGIPGVANLDRSLLRALRRAATDAADDGVAFFVNSGWRSREYQGRLLRDAVSKYGSEREAARWVAAPKTSAHVSGDAVDVGFAATAWLSQHGAEYGLCQIYRNELWHFELRPDAIDDGCPPMYADPTHDPRMQQ